VRLRGRTRREGKAKAFGIRAENIGIGCP